MGVSTLGTFLSPEDVATRLGFSLDWVYKRINNGEFQGAVKLGRSIRIPEEAVARMLEEQNAFSKLKTEALAAGILVKARRKRKA